MAMSECTLCLYMLWSGVPASMGFLFIMSCSLLHQSHVQCLLTCCIERWAHASCVNRCFVALVAVQGCFVQLHRLCIAVENTHATYEWVLDMVCGF